MRYLIFLLLAVTSGAAALDLCPQYVKIHAKDVEPRIKSGIPFKLLSLASDGGQTYRKIVRIEYDLWSEKVGVETLGGEKQVVSIDAAQGVICQQLSFTNVKSRDVRFQILLNPDLSDGLSKLKSQGSGKSGFLGINWKRLAQDLNSEKLLLEGDGNP
jgi:hypothetical protein